MDEITLINPDSPFLMDPKVMPPLGLLYIAASLKESGVKVYFRDLAGIPSSRFGLDSMGNLLRLRPRLPDTEFYGITATTPQFPDAIAILKAIKDFYPESKVCIGGPHATLRPGECLQAGFDYVIEGEGERAINYVFHLQKGVLRHDVEDINALPFPDRTLVKDYSYMIDGVRSTTMMTSRGNCPYKCAFCSKSWIHPIRFRSPENVRRELEEVKGLDYGGVMFYDDELFVNRERDMKICASLKALGLKWRCFTRANLVDEEVAEVAAESGCKEMLIGIESGSDTILENIHKGTTVKQNMQAIIILSNSGIRVKAAMIVGLPGESEKTLTETWEFCDTLKPLIAEFDFTTLVPYPGSPIYEKPEEYDIHFDKKDVYTPYKGGAWKSIVSTSNLSKEDITMWREKFHRKFKDEVQ